MKKYMCEVYQPSKRRSIFTTIVAESIISAKKRLYRNYGKGIRVAHIDEMTNKYGLRKGVVNEEKGDITTVAKGIEDKADAERLAREKQGRVVSDDTDEEKFMVIKSVEEGCAKKAPQKKKSKKKLNEAIYDNEYEAEVEVSLYSRSDRHLEVAGRSSKIKIPYNLEFEIRDWGVKDVIVQYLDKDISIDCVAMYEDREEDITLTFNLSKMAVHTDWEEGNNYAPIRLELEVLEDNEVEKAQIDFTYWSPK